MDPPPRAPHVHRVNLQDMWAPVPASRAPLGCNRTSAPQCVFPPLWARPRRWASTTTPPLLPTPLALRATRALEGLERLWHALLLPSATPVRRRCALCVGLGRTSHLFAHRLQTQPALAVLQGRTAPPRIWRLPASACSVWRGRTVQGMVSRLPVSVPLAVLECTLQRWARLPPPPALDASQERTALRWVCLLRASALFVALDHILPLLASPLSQLAPPATPESTLLGLVWPMPLLARPAQIVLLDRRSASRAALQRTELACRALEARTTPPHSIRPPVRPAAFAPAASPAPASAQQLPTPCAPPVLLEATALALRPTL